MTKIRNNERFKRKIRLEIIISVGITVEVCE